MTNQSFFSHVVIAPEVACDLRTRRSCDAYIIESWLSERCSVVKKATLLKNGWYEVRFLAPVALLPKLRAWADGENILDEL